MVYRANVAWAKRTSRLIQRVNAAGGTTAYERERKTRLISTLAMILRGRLGAQRPLAAIVAFSNVPAAEALDSWKAFWSGAEEHAVKLVKVLRFINDVEDARSRRRRLALEDLREAVETLEDLVPTARRVLGDAHPIAENIGASLRNARAALRARETSRSAAA